MTELCTSSKHKWRREYKILVIEIQGEVYMGVKKTFNDRRKVRSAGNINLIKARCSNVTQIEELNTKEILY